MDSKFYYILMVILFFGLSIYYVELWNQGKKIEEKKKYQHTLNKYFLWRDHLYKYLESKEGMAVFTKRLYMEDRFRDYMKNRVPYEYEVQIEDIFRRDINVLFP